MSDFYQQSANLTPALYQAFKYAIETGKWPDGRLVSDKQKATLLEAIIVYEHQNLRAEQHTGQMEAQCASQSKNNRTGDSDDDDWQTLVLQ